MESPKGSHEVVSGFINKADEIEWQRQEMQIEINKHGTSIRQAR